MIIDKLNGIRVLTPADGMWLTNGKTWSKRVYLAVNADPYDWSETSTPPPDPDNQEDDLTDTEALSIITGGASDA